MRTLWFLVKFTVVATVSAIAILEVLTRKNTSYTSTQHNYANPPTEGVENQ